MNFWDESQASCSAPQDALWNTEWNLFNIADIWARDGADEEEEDEDVTYGKVVCPRYPASKGEGWWLVIGDTHSNSLLSIKRFTLNKEAKVRTVLLIYE